MNFDARIRENYDDGAHKLLHEQRDAYIAQSARTKDGSAAEYRAPGTDNEGEVK